MATQLAYYILLDSLELCPPSFIIKFSLFLRAIKETNTQHFLRLNPQLDKVVIWGGLSEVFRSITVYLWSHDITTVLATDVWSVQTGCSILLKGRCRHSEKKLWTNFGVTVKEVKTGIKAITEFSRTPPLPLYYLGTSEARYRHIHNHTLEPSWSRHTGHTKVHNQPKQCQRMAPHLFLARTAIHWWVKKHVID